MLIAGDEVKKKVSVAYPAIKIFAKPYDGGSQKFTVHVGQFIQRNTASIEIEIGMTLAFECKVVVSKSSFGFEKKLFFAWVCSLWR